MTIFECLRELENRINNAHIPFAHLDAEVLLSLALKKDRSFILAREFDQIAPSALRRARGLLKRRLTSEPIAYIRGSQMFYGRSFIVNRHTLIPRPETELVIEKLIKELPRLWNGTFIDIGTGSGAIAITLAREFPHAQITAIDNSLDAIAVARKNARHLNPHQQTRILYGNLLKPLANNWTCLAEPRIIVANLPYVPTKIWKRAEPQVRDFEPRDALDGGADGLKHYRRLLQQLKKTVALPASLWSEIDSTQIRSFPALVSKYFPRARVKICKDLNNRARLVQITF